MASVEYLETVYPLDYPGFQNILSSGFSKRRKLSAPGESTNAHECPATSNNTNAEALLGNGGVRASEYRGKTLSNNYSSENSGSESSSESDSNDYSESEADLGSMDSSGSSSHPDITERPRPVDNYAIMFPPETAIVRPAEPPNKPEVPTSDNGPPVRQEPKQMAPILKNTHHSNPVVRVLGVNKKPTPRKKVSFPTLRWSSYHRRAVYGTFHLNSPGKGLSKYRGLQSTSIALAAIMVSKSLPVHTWIPSDIDSILQSGDRVHEILMSDLDRSTEDGELALCEIQSGREYVYAIPVPTPKKNWFEDCSVKLKMVLRKSLEYHGKLRSQNACSRRNKLGLISMEDALSHIFDYGFDGALIKVGNNSGALFRDLRGNLRFFDPHSNNRPGQNVRRGSAVLLKFTTFSQLLQHFKRKERDPQCKFEILGVSVSVVGRFAAYSHPAENGIRPSNSKYRIM